MPESATAKASGNAVEAHDAEAKRPSRLFISYVVRLVFRSFLFAVSIAAFVLWPEQIDPANFGIAGGFNLIDLIFLAVLADIFTKFFRNANIAMGSLKQYRKFHVASAFLLLNDSEGDSTQSYIQGVIQQGKIAIEQVPERLRTAWQETRDGALDSIKVLIGSFAIRKLLPLSDEQLQATDPIRAMIRHDRYREIIPVVVFWLVFNAAVGALLSVLGWLTPDAVVLWMLFYFLFDMICVVFWCPLQLVFMKNRCCTTCQIFNWDAAMTVTPLLFICWQLQFALFTWPLIALALIVLVRWEVAFVRHPERFDERTNSSLSCANCNDKLCYFRNPLVSRLSEATEKK